MRRLKNIFTLGVIVLFGVLIIHYLTPPRTVDFRGEIRGVTVSEDGTVTLLATNIDTGDFLFRITDKSKLENCCGEKLGIDDLSQGAMVDINYRKYLFKKEDVRAIKTLKMYKPSTMKPPDN